MEDFFKTFSSFIRRLTHENKNVNLNGNVFLKEYADSYSHPLIDNKKK